MAISSSSSPANVAGEEYISLVEVGGEPIHERTDALRWDGERHVIEARYGFAIAQLRQAGARRVLDIASGLGYGTWLLARAGLEVTGIELSAVALQTARARYPWIDFQQGNALEFEHAPVDAIVATEFIEHIPDARPFFERAAAALKPGGLLIMTTPNRRYSTGRNPFHVHEYTVPEMRALLPHAAYGTLHTRLFKPGRLWTALLGEERYARANYRLSRCFPFHQLPQYAHTFSIVATRLDLDAALGRPAARERMTAPV